jgi:hypothetical protein
LRSRLDSLTSCSDYSRSGRWSAGGTRLSSR